jgi:arylsulfatase A-like enzyme
VARVVDTVRDLAAAGDDTLLIVCSDHGMETTRRTISLDDLLVEARLKAGPGSSDVVVAPNGTAAVLYRAAGARAGVADLERYLDGQDWVGRVFSGPALATLGLPVAAPVALAITLAAEHAPNPYGVWGVSDIVADPSEPKDYTGFGQHGGLGPNEQRPFLFVRGGGFPEATGLDAAVSHVDVAPTILRHLGLAADGMDGRPLPRAAATVG